MKEPMIMRRKAMPPPIPRAKVKRLFVKPEVSVKLIQPIAVGNSVVDGFPRASLQGLFQPAGLGRTGLGRTGRVV